MKKINWQIVMFVAIVAMLTGLGVSLIGLDNDQHSLVLIGLGIIAAVCVSWWFWVMFVIKTMITGTAKTTDGLHDIKTKLGELKVLVQDLIINKDNK